MEGQEWGRSEIGMTAVLTFESKRYRSAEYASIPGAIQTLLEYLPITRGITNTIRYGKTFARANRLLKAKGVKNPQKLLASSGLASQAVLKSKPLSTSSALSYNVHMAGRAAVRGARVGGPKESFRRTAISIRNSGNRAATLAGRQTKAPRMLAGRGYRAFRLLSKISKAPLKKRILASTGVGVEKYLKAQGTLRKRSLLYKIHKGGRKTTRRVNRFARRIRGKGKKPTS